jgi:cell volume regulation protein A
VPTLAHRLGIPLRTVDPEPWALGVRFSEEPEGLHRFHVAAASRADGITIDGLPCGEDVWISLIVRDGNLVTASRSTRLKAGDDVIVLSDPDNAPQIEALFTAPAASSED